MIKRFFDELTDAEKRAYYKLYKVTGDNVWCIAARNATRHGDTECFRHLLNQLQQQANDNPALMKKILGESAYDAVVSLEVSLISVS